MASRKPDPTLEPPSSAGESTSLYGFALQTDPQRVMGWMRSAGRLALALQADTEVDYKADGTPQTPADRRVQDFLVRKIRRQFPGHAILSEEMPPPGGEHQACWVIDPIDGTRAYASSLPVWSISVGLVVGETVVFGACYLPAMKQMIWGTSEGAFFNNRPIQPINIGLDDPLACLLVPSNTHRKYRISFPRLRSLGSTAAHLAYLAHGSAVGVITREISAWDIVGVYPAIKAAGIRLEYLSGSSFSLKALLDGETAAGPLLAAPHDLFVRLLSLIIPINH